MSEVFELDKEIRIAVMTVSDTRTRETDTGGALVRELAVARNMKIAAQTIVKDDGGEIEGVMRQWLADVEIDAIISTGGTGIAGRDISIEAIAPFYDKELPGFGELFRYLSFTEDIGTRALLTRASAGVANETAIFILPGSRGAVELAMERLVLPELQHIVFELKKHHQSRA
ncbi:molybdenum cofactor biosynthesis protein B [Planomicrobium sp. YIM 101495]|uniref:MogA/MoaB family molybdenum cofactor biosynthesis protein n=1 Tax=Planomicrobium sp. YIM 101495 TaxID=2665160 RepID=UPI0012B7DF3C|nr:MogA/MoaB family molybdenum cofactor biosynthesis protein [Planomicrobium sp. YIM 101495]MTD29502.1 molybdenum cofactor biosynthesis protein [Planomicrobium sp. YIM 101495]